MDVKRLRIYGKENRIYLANLKVRVMEAKKVNLTKYMQNVHFIIPIYQRKYSWGIEECEQLWDDVLRVGKDENCESHFFGAMVCVNNTKHHYETNKLLMIDGQQRLTTIFLLLLAISKTMDPDEAERIHNQYLINSFKKDELRKKIILTAGDQEELEKLLQNKPIDEFAGSRIFENYYFFQEKLKTESPQKIFCGVEKLEIVDVSLDPIDSPQLIFESLNSTGMSLTQSDLIRNLLLMEEGYEKQSDLYHTHWRPIEERFSRADKEDRFDRFIRDFMTIQSDAGDISNLGEVYKNYKKYYLKSRLTNEEALAELEQFSRHYEIIYKAKSSDKEIQSMLAELKILRFEVSHPFLLRIFDDFEKNNITREQVLEIIRTIISYVVRRQILNLATNSQNKIFATLYSKLDKNYLLESFYAMLLGQSDFDNFPTDDSFKSQLVMRNLYDMKNTPKYLLVKLENHTHKKEIINPEEYTIEHILPQNRKLSLEWKEMLGPDWEAVQNKYVNTLGNLTLTGYNSELSDRPFKEKQDTAYNTSPLLLNKYLSELPKWGEEEIKARSALLAEKAVSIWRYPTITSKVSEFIESRKEKQTRRKFDLDDFNNRMDAKGQELLEEFRSGIFKLSPDINEIVNETCISYKVARNFLMINPRKTSLLCELYGIEFEELDNPDIFCQKSPQNWWSNAHFRIKSKDDIPKAIRAVGQALAKQVNTD